MPPMCRFNLPGNSMNVVPAHQDVSYNSHLGGPFLSFWVPLVDINKRCGGVRLWKGTKDWSRQPTESKPGVAWQSEIRDRGCDKAYPHMRPGDCLVFGPNVVHESVPNSSNHIRYNVDFRLFPASTPSTKHWMDMESGIVTDPTKA
jgi:ectoine hydroxylase-related dioxygenase (phytanoyl-CoA dioxygenase family)